MDLISLPELPKPFNALNHNQNPDIWSPTNIDNNKDTFWLIKINMLRRCFFCHSSFNQSLSKIINLCTPPKRRYIDLNLALESSESQYRGSFSRGIRFLRSQDVIRGSKPSFLGKACPTQFQNFQILCPPPYGGGDFMRIPRRNAMGVATTQAP